MKQIKTYLSFSKHFRVVKPASLINSHESFGLYKPILMQRAPIKATSESKSFYQSTALHSKLN